MFTMADVTRTHAAQRPDKPALICDDRTLTYGELHTESCRVANALLDAGVAPQDRVGFILWLAMGDPSLFLLLAPLPTYTAALGLL